MNILKLVMSLKPLIANFEKLPPNSFQVGAFVEETDGWYKVQARLSPEAKAAVEQVLQGLEELGAES